ncbi:hypothetical protein M3172_19315 [Mesobacillus subterraneus]|uniref:hypothetical protein n=1 Tax=Mesobacillus subterraneus TaxID=285983 RepID=UPI0020425961|nr:hypothetical protein [Mesobacillus subterraneus]MCM3575353.1 hypothetical protein [Mesobacillus subterraneus]
MPVKKMGVKILRRYLYGSLLLIFIVVIFFNLYKYREQNLADLVDINRVEKIYIMLGNKRPEGQFELSKADDETIKTLTDFLSQYKVRLTTKGGYSSDHPSEQFELYLGYEDGDLGLFIFERDIVAGGGIHKVLNPPLDYKVIEKLEQDINSK